MGRRLFPLGMALCTAWIHCGVQAHHAVAGFFDPTDSVEIQGIVTAIRWQNPHTEFLIEVVEETGESTMWRAETGALGVLRARGLEREFLHVGDRVRAMGFPSVRGLEELFTTNLLLPDGTEVIMGVNFGPHWDGPFVGGATEFSGQDPTVVDAAGENLGIFRVWSIPGRGVGLTQHLPFRPHAVVARADWDPIDNPITRCEQPGMPTVMLQPGPFRFIRAGEDIVLHSPYFDTRRTIHMDLEPDAATQPVSPVGFSRGRWEGNTLVVATTRIGWPYFDSSGTP